MSALTGTPFEGQRLLGAGSTAEVFVADVDGRKVAVKKAHGTFTSSQEDLPFLAQPWAFYEEGVGPWELEPKVALAAERALLERLDHPAFVKVDALQSEAPDDTLVLEYVEGSSWRELIGHDTLGLGHILAVAEAIEAAQLKFHGDLKPDNLMLADDQVRILDPSFGVAELQDGRPHSLLTTAWYNPVLAASDVPSLGLVLAEVMLGRHPFLGASENKLTPDLSEAIDWMCNAGFGATTTNYRTMDWPATSAGWDAVALRCLGMERRGDTFDVADAYRSVADVCEALRPLCEKE